MTITFLPTGHVTISMRRYLEEALRDYYRPVSREAHTPAQRNLFEVDPSSPLLPPRCQEFSQHRQ
jgi:hypothetical protein